MCTIPVLGRICRESYTDPEELYEKLKRQGMDLVTVTDHDSIDAAETLRHHPDFFLSEEVTARMPSGTELHVGVYDITERQHLEIQGRRNDLPSLLAYLSEKHLVASVNHVFSGLTGKRDVSDFTWFAEFFSGVETRNGQMLTGVNGCAERFAAFFDKAALGGSDAHTLASAGTTWTEVPRARTKEEFFAAIARGEGRALGESGGYAKLTRDVFLIAAAAIRERKWLLALAPLAAAAIPIWTLTNCIQESMFVKSWKHILEAAPQSRPALSTVGRQALPEVAA
jgi:predicted metal-dependent phosphoesterase TrpH